MTYKTEDLDLLLTNELERCVREGYVPRSVAAWRADCRQDFLENERAYPGFITKSAAGLRAKAQGKRITYCSESRGTHAISYVYDPRGTTEPPAWWNRDEAKREHDALHPPATRRLKAV